MVSKHSILVTFETNGDLNPEKALDISNKNSIIQRKIARIKKFHNSGPEYSQKHR